MTEVLHGDVAVVGGGPAGIAAAVAAASTGRGVVLLDEGSAPGGQIWRPSRVSPPGVFAARWLDRLARSGARVEGDASVFDVEEDRLMVARRGSRLVVRAASIVIATGARELFLPFSGWTLANVLGAGAAQALLKSGGSFAGRRAVVAGSGPLLLPVAASLRRGGARIACVAEQAPAAAVRRFAAALWRHPAKVADAVKYRAGFWPSPYRLGAWAQAARGRGRVEAVVLADGRRTWEVACDVLCCAYGLVPNLELARLFGCRTDATRVIVDAEQRTSVANVFAAGETTGVGGADLALAEGRIAGLAAAGATVPGWLRKRRDTLRLFAAAISTAFALRGELRRLATPDTIVCRCEDVARSRFDPSWTMRKAKLYTRAGMGPCQGRVCGPALGFLFGWEADSVRPPLKPVDVSTLEAEP